MRLSRRDVLKWGTGAAAMLAAGVPALGEEAEEVAKDAEPAADGAKKIPLALQLYSVRTDCQRDLPGTIAAVGKMGYKGVEFAGYYNYKAEELRKMLDDNGLLCCGTHTALNTLQGDALKATVEFNKTLGNKYLMIPSLDRNLLASEEAIVKTAKILTEIADRAKADAMRVGFHSHDGEFQKIGDRTVWDVLLSAAGPEVCGQLDVGHCLTGGGDPYAELKKFADRAVTIHLTDAIAPTAGARGRSTIVGEGDLKLDEIFKICETAGKTEWYIVEQEVYPVSPLDSVKRSLDNLRKMGK